MAIKLQIRRDILANWNANQTVVLLEGEIGYVTDTRNMKIGDGATQWQFLKYQAPFYTGTNSSLATTTLSVDQSNNRVGIGTTNPTALLDVSGGQIRVRNGSAYSSPSGNTGVLNYDNTGGILTVDARSDGGTTAIAFHTSNATVGAERVRIRASGNVLETNGIVTSNRTTAGTFVVSGDGAYTFGTDTKQYIYGKPGNDGNVAIYTTTAAGATNDRLNVTSTAVQVKTALTTTSTATIGDALTVTTGGLTVTAGGLTVTAGSVSLPATSLSGVSITANTLAPSKISNMAAAGVLGATVAGAVTELTTGSGGTAKTALGLGSAAYTNGTDFICALNQVGQIAFVSFGDSGTGTDAGVYTGVTSSSTTGPNGGGNTSAPTYVSFGGTTTWSKPGSGTRYVRPSQGTWTCIQTNNSTSGSTTVLSMICIRTA